jgi:hypothetical protein
MDSGRFMGPAVFFFSFFVYLITLAPEVTFWDSGELIFGAVTLGIPHPPGYPMFSMLGRAFSLLPFGSAAYRINLMSAFFAASTVYLLYRVVRDIGAGSTGASLIAASASLGFAFYRFFWAEAVVAEVYTINTFLIIAAANLLFRYDRDKDVASLHASSFLLGLALANHQSVMFILPVYLVYFLFSGQNYRKPEVIAVSLSLFLLAFSVVIYLPVRDVAGHLALDIGDPRFLHDFVWVMKWDTYYALVKAVAGNLSRHFTLAWLAAGVFAAAVCFFVVRHFRKDGFMLFMVFSALFSYAAIMALTFGAEGIEKMGLKGKFFIPAVLLAVPVLARIFIRAWDARPKSGAARAVVTAVLVLMLAAIPAWGLASNYKEVDNSRNFFAYDFATNTLKSVRQDAALFAWGDNGVFPVWYLQGFERFRDDVLFVHTELLTYEWYMSDIQKRMFNKYGIAFVPRARLGQLDKNVAGMRARLQEKTPVYFDFSAMMRLSIPVDSLTPQGLVHLDPSHPGRAYEEIWDKYVTRGAFDNTTNKAFAAEGILGFYAWEAAVWAQHAYTEGRPYEALQAYEAAKKLGLSSAEFDDWARNVMQELVQRGK